jgi:hypothetical protein
MKDSFSLREKARMRGYKSRATIVDLIPFYARRLIGYSPTLSRKEKGFMGH